MAGDVVRPVVVAVSVLERAHEWIVGDDTGVSSETIWTVMMGVKLRREFSNEPFDPADLGRCLRLLKLIPEWQPRLHEMASVSKRWARLVENWDALASLMDREVGIDWSKGRSAPLTYEKMKVVLGGDR